jgi:hypothetical protein
MKSAYTRAFGVLLAGALLSGGAVACKSSDSKASDAPAAKKPAEASLTPVAAVRRAAAKAAEVKSLKYTMSGTVGSQGAMHANAAMTLDPVAMDMTMTTAKTGSEQLTVRLVGGTMYIDAGKTAAAQMNGKRWLKLNLKDLSKSSGTKDPLTDLGQQVNQDPSSNLALLEQSGDIKKVGQETVDGVSTTHYAGTIDVADLSSGKFSAGAAGKERAEKTLAQFKQLGAQKLTMDLWVGPDDRTVKVRERASSKQGPIDLTVRFSDFNEKVTVTAPPASQTFDFGQMMKQGARS